MDSKKIKIGQTTLQCSAKKIIGEFIKINDVEFYKISHYDQMRPFFMSLVSHSDQWLFISSLGGLTAGRKNPDNALFPYTTDDKIHDSQEQTGSKTILLVTKENETQVNFPKNNKLYKTYLYTDRDKTKKGFFVVLSEGENYALVLKEKIVFVEEQKPKTPYEKYKNPELKRVKDTYYLSLKGSKTLSEIKLRKKDVINFFENDSKMVSSLIKKNKLNVKKEEDLIRLLKLYDNQSR